MSDASLARYARAIEKRWTEFLGGPVVLSPGDWRWISEWHERGIPLQLIVECVDAADARRRAGGGPNRPRGLSYVARAVKESWEVILEGRASQAAQETTGDSPEPLEAWRRRAREEAAGSPLRTLLEGLISDLGEGADAEGVDGALDRALHGAVPPELNEAAQAEARSWLEAHRSRMSEQEFEEAVQRAATVRLRRRLQLPRLVP